MKNKSVYVLGLMAGLFGHGRVCHAMTAAPLGDDIQLVLSGGTNVGVYGSSGNQTLQVSGSTSLGFFIIPHIYVGLGASLDYTRSNSTPGPTTNTYWNLELVPQAGLALNFGSTVTLFPKAGLVYNFISSSESSDELNAIGIRVLLPLVIQMAPQIGFTVGPQATFGLKQADTVHYGINTGILAWF